MAAMIRILKAMNHQIINQPTNTLSPTHILQILLVVGLEPASADAPLLGVGVPPKQVHDDVAQARNASLKARGSSRRKMRLKVRGWVGRWAGPGRCAASPPGPWQSPRQVGVHGVPVGVGAAPQGIAFDVFDAALHLAFGSRPAGWSDGQSALCQAATAPVLAAGIAPAA